MGRLERIADLDRSLTRLATPPQVAPTGLLLTAYGTRSALAALVEAIDDTVMPQVLRVSAGSRGTLRLTAGNRRLIDLRPEPDCAVPAWSSDDAEPGALERIGEDLRFFVGDGPLYLVPEGAAAPAPGSGVPATDLARHWGLSGPRATPDPGDLVEHVQVAFGPALAAWVATNGEEEDGSGDAELGAILMGLIARLAEPLRTLRGGQALTAQIAGRAAVVVQSGEVTLGFALSHKEPAEAARLSAELRQILCGWAEARLHE